MSSIAVGAPVSAAGPLAVSDVGRCVLVAHPLLQHSHQMALAMHEMGKLQVYLAGVPVAAPGEALPFWLPARFKQKVRRVPIPPQLRQHPVRFQLAMRGGLRFLPGSVVGHGDWLHRIFHWFDAWTAHQIKRYRPRVVIGYENSSYHTFAAAKSVGAFCVLDAASLHHRTSRELVPFNPSPYEAEVTRRKDAEVEAADLVLTCSPMAAESYVSNGVPPSKVRSVLLGAELPEGMAEQPRVSNAAPRFIFAGALSRRKSVDLILDVFSRLAREGLSYELLFVGDAGDRTLLEQLRTTPRAEHRASMGQQALYPLMAQADCLLLPSRFDSFGMVVAEAMACGTPALVSTHTGAKALVEHVPGSGWIVEPDAESLYAQVRALVLQPELLARARPFAQRASSDFTWHAYRRRVAAVLKEEALC